MTARRYGLLAAVVLAIGFTAIGVVLIQARDDTEKVGRPPALELFEDAARGCGDVSVRTWDEGTWRCTFSDDFDGAALDLTKWRSLTRRDTDFSAGGECTSNDQSNVSVAEGLVRLTVRSAPQPFTCPGKPPFVSRHTGAAVSTVRLFDQAFGRFEIRARFPAVTVPGVQSAIWLWPSNHPYGPWPRSGEIDIAEYYSQHPDRVVPFVHYAWTTVDPTATNTSCLVERPDRFHSYVLEWTPDAITIAFDGTICVRTTWDRADLPDPAPFDHPFFLNLTQALGVEGNAYDPSLTPLPATMEVDHVYVWG